MDSPSFAQLLQDFQCSAPTEPKAPQVEQTRIRPWKKRASKACANCRARKVRCDVVARGAPCSNCRHDEVQCALPTPSRRKRKMNFAGPDETVFSVNEIFMPDSPIRALMDTEVESRTAILNGKEMTPGDSGIFDESTAIDFFSANCDLQTQDDIPSTSWLPSPHHLENPISSSSFVNSTTIPDDSSAPLSIMFKPFPSKIEEEDIKYLRKMGALTVPPKFLQIELLRCYTEYFHPQYPILDLEEFSAIIQNPTAHKHSVSLLLFQAVIFSGSRFASLKTLRKAGFQTREEAHEVFFKRARLLYTFDTEPDILSLLQSLLFMTSRHNPCTEQHPWHYWLQIAISLAFRIGLHRSALSPSLSARKRRLYRRIWWTCVICDRLVAVREGKPVSIRNEDCDVQMLGLADFDFGETASGGEGGLAGGSANEEEEGDELGDEAIRGRETAIKIIDKAMLCWHGENFKEIPAGRSSAVKPALKFRGFDDEFDLMNADGGEEKLRIASKLGQLGTAFQDPVESGRLGQLTEDSDPKMPSGIGDIDADMTGVYA